MRTRRAVALALVAVSAALGGTVAASLPAAAGGHPGHGPSADRGPALVSRATLSETRETVSSNR